MVGRLSRADQSRLGWSKAISTSLFLIGSSRRSNSRNPSSNSSIMLRALLPARGRRPLTRPRAGPAADSFERVPVADLAGRHHAAGMGRREAENVDGEIAQAPPAGVYRFETTNISC